MFQSSFIAYPAYPMRFVEWKKPKEKYHSLIYIFSFEFSLHLPN